MAARSFRSSSSRGRDDNQEEAIQPAAAAPPVAAPITHRLGEDTRSGVFVAGSFFGMRDGY